MRPAFLSTVLSSISLKINCGKYTTFLFVIHLGFVFRKFCVLEDFIGVAPCFYLGVSRNPLSNAARFLLQFRGASRLAGARGKNPRVRTWDLSGAN